MTVNETAEHLGMSPRTLYNWGSLGIGPPRHRVGGQVRYLRAEVDAWVAAQPGQRQRKRRKAG